jgi:hypothetical protein
MNRHEKIENIIKYSCILVLIILYNEILHNYKFGQAHNDYLLKRNTTQFSLHFKELYSIFCDF